MDAGLCALIRLNPLSISQLAESIGLLKPNLLAAMAGKRPLPERFLGPLIAAVGLLPNGLLATERVYCWRVRDADHLASLGATGTLEAITLYPIRPLKKSALQSEYWLLSGRSGVIAIIRAKPEIVAACVETGMALGKPITGIPDPATWWQQGVPKSVVTVLLTERHEASGSPMVSWEDVIRDAERRKVSPEVVMRFLDAEGA